MAIWEDVKKITSDFAHSTADISKKLAEITRLNLNNAKQEDNIKSLYMEIGKQYYEEHCGMPEDSYASCCSKIKASQEMIEENSRQIAALKSSLKREDRSKPIEASFQTVETESPEEDEPTSEPIGEIRIDRGGTIEPTAEIKIKKTTPQPSCASEPASNSSDDSSQKESVDAGAECPPEPSSLDDASKEESE